MNYPPLPVSLDGHPMSEEELREIWYRVCVEIMDRDYMGRTHGNRRTYDAGCKGPLCSKASREHGRRRTATEPNEYYKFLDPIIEHFWPIAMDRIELAQKRILEEIAAS